MSIHRWLPLALAGMVAAGCETLSPDGPGNLVPATVTDDPALPAIELNGSRFHAQTFGDRHHPVVIFLHGGPGGDYRSMLTLAARHNGYSLADDHFLVYWDQRGAGLSQRHNRTTLTIATYVADLHALIDRYSPDRPVYLVGVSWGGMFATRYINQYPERVAGAVLIESGPLDGATMERIRDDMFDDDLRREWLNDFAWHSQFISPDTHARMDYERMLGARDAQPNFGTSRTNPEPGWRQGALANRYITKDGQNGKGVFTYDFTTNLAAYTTPVLFIAGARSRVLGESLQSEQIERFPNAALVVLDGAGHDVAWIRAADTVALIRSYLAARHGGAQ